MDIAHDPSKISLECPRCIRLYDKAFDQGNPASPNFDPSSGGTGSRIRTILAAHSRAITSHRRSVGREQIKAESKCYARDPYVIHRRIRSQETLDIIEIVEAKQRKQRLRSDLDWINERLDWAYDRNQKEEETLSAATPAS